MDLNGSTVASSNRNDPDSFVGENFSFRPYWKQAIGGTPATYMALGVTSGKRGVFYSHPVREGAANSLNIGATVGVIGIIAVVAVPVLLVPAVNP